MPIITKDQAQSKADNRLDRSLKNKKHKKEKPLLERDFNELEEGVKKLSKNASIAMNVLDTQPGIEYASGSWWQAFNAVTYVTDHLHGRTADSRLQSAWYGYHKGVKTKALETAIEYAEAA